MNFYYHHYYAQYRFYAIMDDTLGTITFREPEKTCVNFITILEVVNLISIWSHFNLPPLIFSGPFSTLIALGLIGLVNYLVLIRNNKYKEIICELDSSASSNIFVASTISFLYVILTFVWLFIEFY